MLAPEHELTTRCLATSKESDARLVGKIGGGPEGCFYGVEFLDPEVDLWDIEFPPLAESEMAVACLLLECVRCHTRELTYLDALEAEVFEANQCLSRHCKRCTAMSIWKSSLVTAAGEQIPLPVQPHPISEPPAAPPTRTENERKEVRIHLEMTACIRHPQYGEEIVATENVSRGGFCFKSPKRYTEGLILEVAVPYSPSAGNIFMPAG